MNQRLLVFIKSPGLLFQMTFCINDRIYADLNFALAEKVVKNNEELVCVCVCMFTLWILRVNAAVFPYGWSVWRYFVFISCSDISIFWKSRTNQSSLFSCKLTANFTLITIFLNAFIARIVEAFGVRVIFWMCVPRINTCMTSFPRLPRKGFSFPAWLNTHNEAVQVNRQQPETHQSLTQMSVIGVCRRPDYRYTDTHTRSHPCLNT